jgi:hypothetical protein
MDSNSFNTKVQRSILPLDELTALVNGKGNVLEKLDVLYLHVEGKAREMIGWYLTHKRVPALWSQGLRFLAIVCAGFGGLCPLLQSFDPHFNQLGYVSLGLVAAFVGVDKFFGFSSAWMRYMLMQIRLQKKFAEFQLEWLKRRSFVDKDLSKEQAEVLFSFLQAFQVDLLAEVEKETQSWVAEFQSNLVQLDKISKEHAATTTNNK